MARPRRLESEDGIYHVRNRGNYRAEIIRSANAKQAFLTCLGEACAKTGWRVHAWCVMSNHYHLAVYTPRANLVEGMRWLQGTFANRFNRLRLECGHLFQGRYKSLVVDPGDGLGPLCHHIHLNPARVKLCAAEESPQRRWVGLRWVMNPKERPAGFDPQPAPEHAGALAATPAGREKYLRYLAWLAEDETARNHSVSMP